jgi:hypothetical protein
VMTIMSTNRKNTNAWRIPSTVTSARSCNKVGHLFWFTILAQHETNDVILYIHNVHKHRGSGIKHHNPNSNSYYNDKKEVWFYEDSIFFKAKLNICLHEHYISLYILCTIDKVQGRIICFITWVSKFSICIK